MPKLIIKMTWFIVPSIMQTYKFRHCFSFFTAMNHPNRPHRKQNLSSTRPKGHI